MRDRGNRLLRVLDRWFGIPLIFFLGIFHLKKRNIPKKIESIGLLVSAAIGDTILISALVQELKETIPVAKLTLFCGKSNIAMAKLSCPGVKVVEIPINRPVKAIEIIRKEGRQDSWIDTGPWPRINSLISAFSGGYYKIGYKTPGEARHFIYDIAVDHRNDRHEMENIRALGAPLKIKGNIKPDLSHLFSIKKNNTITIHMYPGGFLSHYKEWSEELWIKLIDNITASGYSVNLTGAPPDRDRALLLKERCKKNGKIIISAGKTGLKETGQILADSLLVISVNTGIMHYAAALPVPLIALHGPTSPLRWGPISDNSISLAGTGPGSGVLNLGFEYKKGYSNTMDSITPDQVMEALNKLLKGESK